MSKEILVQNVNGILFVAFTNFNKVQQFFFEKENQNFKTNDIYKGRIMSPRSAIDLGKGAVGILEHRSIPIREEEKDILVQILETNDSDKISVTKNITLKGYAVTYTPFHPQENATVCVGKKNTYLQASEILKGLKFNPTGGFIFHTREKPREKKELYREAKSLCRIWELIEKTYKKSQSPALLYQDGVLLWTVIRDHYNNQVENIIVEGEELYQHTKAFVKHLVGPSAIKKITQYKGNVSLFKSKGIFDKALDIYKSQAF